MGGGSEGGHRRAVVRMVVYFEEIKMHKIVKYFYVIRLGFIQNLRKTPSC